MSWYRYKPYVSAHQRRREGEKKIKALKAKGVPIEPLAELSSRMKIATSFWGRAWCDHLESFSDYDNRLPRGRTYVRNGSVLHLSIEPGVITALVQGSELYEQTIRVEPLSARKWKAIQSRCQGGIGSLIELLQGKISSEIMAIVTDRNSGLFPKPKEIEFSCSCPDWAVMCKHIAAILYGVGARLDSRPELLFKLRGVDHNDLIASASDAATLGDASSSSGRRRLLDPTALGEVFDIDLDETAETPAPVKKRISKKRTAKSAAISSHADPKPSSRKRIAGSGRKAASESPSAALSDSFEATGASVRALRNFRGLSQEAFADWLGVSAQSIANWEKKPGPLKLHSTNYYKLKALHRASQ